MTATMAERSTVDVARAELEREEAALTALLNNPQLGGRELREGEDAVAAARHRLVAAEKRAATLFAEGLRSDLDTLAKAAQTLKQEEKKLAALDQQTRIKVGELATAIASINGQVDDLCRRIQATIAQGQAAGLDVGAIAAERGLAPLEPGTLRLLGGLRIGDLEVMKHQAPHLSGGVDRAWYEMHPAPPPPAPLLPPSCVDSEGRAFKRHIVTKMEGYTPTVGGYMRPDLKGAYICERCSKTWSAAEYERTFVEGRPEHAGDGI